MRLAVPAVSGKALVLNNINLAGKGMSSVNWDLRRFLVRRR